MRPCRTNGFSAPPDTSGGFRRGAHHQPLPTTGSGGYARVSTSTQNLDRQIGALRAERCDEVYREKASVKAIKGRPQLEKAIDALGMGNVLVVAEWDGATRSMMDGVRIIERIHARGAMIKVLDKPHLDLTTPVGRGFIAFRSALAEDERQRIVKRANEGRAAARKRGVHMGRQPKLTDLPDPAPNLGRATARDQRARASVRALGGAIYTDQSGRSLAQRLAGGPCSGAMARALGPVEAGSRIVVHVFLAAQHPGQRPSPFPLYIETYPCRGAEDSA